MPDILVTIKTQVDKAVADLKKVATGISGVGKSEKETVSVQDKLIGSFTELQSAFSLVDRGLKMVQQAYAATVGQTLEYAKTVKQLSLVSGASAEETSRVIQMTDDLGVEMGTLETAMRGAATKGIVVTTDSLAQMSDEYKKLAPGVERNTYLLEKFGRSGLEMAKVLDAGSNTIRDLSDAVEDGLIIDQKAAKAAEQYRVAVDKLNDAWLALEQGAGKRAIPMLVDVLSDLNTIMTRLQQTKTADIQTTSRLTEKQRMQTLGIDSATLSYIGWGKAIENAGGQAQTTAPKIETAAEKTSNLQHSQEEYLKLIQADDTGRQENWNKALENQLKIAQDLAGAYSDVNGMLGDYNFKTATNKEMQDKLAVALGKTTQAELDKRDAYNKVLEAWAAGKGKEAEWLQMIRDIATGYLSAEDAMKRVAATWAAVPNVQEKTMIFTIQQKGSIPDLGQGDSGDSGGFTSTPIPDTGGEGGGGGGRVVPEAEGGSGMVTKPTLFLAGENGPEYFNFIPRGQAGGNSEVVALLRQIAAKPVLDEGRLTKLLRDAWAQQVRR